MNLGLDQTWEGQFLESLLGMVHVPYGDFIAIANLSKASNDFDSLQKMLDWVCCSPDAQSAVSERFLL